MSEQPTRNEAKVLIIIITAVAGVFLGWWIFSSNMEANAYNRVTGANVTTWDAMWIQLRATSGPIQTPPTKGKQ